MVTDLVPEWDGGLVDFNSDIEYKCLRGQKFLSDFGKTSQKSQCQPGNIWTSVSWGQCVESKTNLNYNTLKQKSNSVCLKNVS